MITQVGVTTKTILLSISFNLSGRRDKLKFSRTLVRKNGKRYLQQAEDSAIRFLIIAEAFKRMAASHVHTRLPICIPMIDWRSVSLRSAHEMFYQFSHPFGCGAFRFLFWWLFLHLWLRPSNVGPTCVKPFAPFSGSCLKGATRFYPRGSRRPLSLPLAKPFGFD